MHRIGLQFCVSLMIVISLASLTAAQPMRELIDADYLRQAEAWSAPPKSGGQSLPDVETWQDAAGAVDGVKDGKYAFHVGWEANPWWQVDLGQSQPIARIVVYNRLDYKPGLHNADNLQILTSDDGEKWTLRHDNQGKHFGGISGAKPLEVHFAAGEVKARFIRLQIPSPQPLWFHLDEVEVYGPDDPAKNLALKRPADQSSVSQWSTAKIARPAGQDSETGVDFRIAEVIERGRRLALDLGRLGADVEPFLAELESISRETATLPENATVAEQQALYLRARWAVRRLAFANPLLDFDRLLVCKRFTQDTYPDVCLNHMPWVSKPGGDICVVTLAGATGEPQVRPVIDGQLGPGHVHGMDLWYDADRVVFGYAKSKTPEGPPDRGRPVNFQLRISEEPIHIFEIGVDGSGLRQLTDSRDWSDLDPTYLPSGDVAFVSERCGASLQCNEYDKDETSCNIYVMRPDGSNIRQLSVTKDGDYLPHTLADGSIGYTRWEYQERGWAHIQSIWYVRPDGTGADALFKQHMNDPWALEDMRSIPGGGTNRLAAIATGHHTLAAGPVVVVTPSVGLNNPQGIAIVTPGVYPPEGGMAGEPVAEGGVPDNGGYYMTPWPLSDKYFLASYTYANQQTDATGYAIFLIDVFGNKELIYRDPAISCFIPVPLKPRPKPDVVTDVTDPDTRYAICSASHITHGVPGIEPGQAKYLRIAHRLQWPYDNVSGGQRYNEKARPNNWTPVQILGEVPIETDGSAHFRVPVDTPLYFQLLDQNHMELRRMRSFISFQPGEQRGCVGCHETRGEAPPTVQGFPLALLQDPAAPEPPPWGDLALSFLRDVQPVFDQHCVACHSGLSPAGGLDFFGGLTADSSGVPGYGFNIAFDTIISNQLVAWSPVQGDASITQPLAFGSHRSKLVASLRDGACSQRVKLSEEEWRRLVTWIDANAPYHDGFVNKRLPTPPYDLPADQQLAAQLADLHTKRCARCHQVEQISRTDWIDVRQPDRSLCLTAPLAAAAGGAARCLEVVYHDRTDEDYQAIRQVIQAAVDRAWSQPRRDLRSLKP